MSGSGAVRLEGVTKRYGDAAVVDGVDLEIPSGEFFTVLGPSGCGKTTTLRMIAGFERPDAGAVLLDGVDVSRTPPHKRNVNTVFQSYALFPHRTVEENVAFGLRYKRCGREETRRRVGEAMELVRLGELGARKPTQLSGGQQQRVALARALVIRPPVLLCDEPLGALDRKLRQQMQFELKQLQKEIGVTLVFVTHDQEEALAMSDRIAVMNAGRIEQLGAPEELYERPTTAFVAGFLGVSNLLEGEVAGQDGSLATIRLKDGTVLRAPGNGASGPVRVGVRPEKLRVVAGQNGSATDGLNTLSGTVLDASYIGVSTQYLVQTSEGHRLTVYAQNLDTAGAAELLADGQHVQLTWNPQHTFVIPGPAEHHAGDPHATEEEEDSDE